MRKGICLIFCSSSLFLLNLLLFHLLEERAILDISDFLLLLLWNNKRLPTIHHVLLVIPFRYSAIRKLHGWELIHRGGSSLIPLHQSGPTAIHLYPHLSSGVYFSLSPRLLLKLIPPRSLKSGLCLLNFINSYRRYRLFNRLLMLNLPL